MEGNAARAESPRPLEEPPEEEYEALIVAYQPDQADALDAERLDGSLESWLAFAAEICRNMDESTGAYNLFMESPAGSLESLPQAVSMPSPAFPAPAVDWSVVQLIEPEEVSLPEEPRSALRTLADLLCRVFRCVCLWCRK